MYKNILVALDLSDEGEQVITKALKMQQATQARLHLAHVIEPISYAYGGDIPLDLGDIQQQLQKHSEEKLQKLIEKHTLTNSAAAVLVGRPEGEIHRYAEENDIDLVIVGSHGRHGLQLLLGSTANGVLHGAKCDVLAVRISD
ncbi:universal stress protein [Hahella sp. CR1]|uniref:universal stress protein n=1 Tax=Hahella sp. CR1 TaxID=2992807 RepID=UPI0024420CA7|nr:universal stress protein [Hahella sp. CR1]MDG9667668.1 universal stress protein [Hahella sp. CR1]